jgi:Electron transfer DM13
MTDVVDQPATDEPVATRRRRRWLWLAATLIVALIVFVLFWFQPQKLFIDDRVEEAIPDATAPSAPTDTGGSTADASPPTGSAAAEPVEVARGAFVSLDHGTTGTARVLELADGRRIVRLEGLDTDNGPDLYLYLTANRADGDEGAFDDDYVNLGRLKGNQGDQNYDLPPGTDIARLATVVIWCDRFDSAFGAADLSLS